MTFSRMNSHLLLGKETVPDELKFNYRHRESLRYACLRQAFGGLGGSSISL